MTNRSTFANEGYMPDTKFFKDTMDIQFGADVIAYMIPEKHPFVMVDHVIDYRSSPLQLFAEHYISANDPVFIGHFPKMKLWPGIHTIEGLRQCCSILKILHKLEKAGLFEGIIELQNLHKMQPKVNTGLCQRVLDALIQMEHQDSSQIYIQMKLLVPVFAGCIIKYHVKQNDQNISCWSVQANVDGKIVAKGEINYEQ